MAHRFFPLFVLMVAGLTVAVPSAAQHHHADDRPLAEDPRLAEGQIAPVLQGLGDHHHPITAKTLETQQFFDQGLKLTYGFNHREALRAFKEAARRDSDAAMAYWGWALVLGPNLNLPMAPEAAAQALEAIEMAVERGPQVSQKERDYIEALATRYAADGDRAELDQAYAEAMHRLHEKYPKDTDAATLYAAALMNLSPWNYWTRDRQARERTDEILATLEAVLAADPEHEGALHYYIHAIEPVDAERGVWAADQLRGLAPGAGHLVHMPSHIYMQVGRYADAFEDNAKAAEADEEYITQCRAQGIYPLNYYPHNVHFQAWAAMVQGRSEAALATARKVAAGVPDDHGGNDWGLFQTFQSMPLYAMVRFGMWQEILAEPKPEADLRLLAGMWHYARGLALVHTGQRGKAKKELRALGAVRRDAATAETYIGFTNAGRLLEIAWEVLAGEIAAKGKRWDSALGHLERAVRLEDSMLYNEPPDWYAPTRHFLGAVLLEAGRPDEAEVVYWRDLEEQRDNGFALYGLWQSLAAQGRHEEALAARQRFDLAWADADVSLTSSRF